MASSSGSSPFLLAAARTRAQCVPVRELEWEPLERYVQSGGSDPHVLIGVQQPYDLFPELKADIVQVSLYF